MPRRGQEPEPTMARLQPALALGLAMCLLLVLGAAVQGAGAEMIERTAHLEVRAQCSVAQAGLGGVRLQRMAWYFLPNVLK